MSSDKEHGNILRALTKALRQLAAHLLEQNLPPPYPFICLLLTLEIAFKMHSQPLFIYIALKKKTFAPLMNHVILFFNLFHLFKHQVKSI